MFILIKNKYNSIDNFNLISNKINLSQQHNKNNVYQRFVIENNKKLASIINPVYKLIKISSK